MPNIIVKYKMYYIEERPNWDSNDIPQTVRGIQGMIRKDNYNKNVEQPPLEKQKQEKYKFNKDIVFEILYCLRGMSEDEQEQDIL